MDLTNDIVSLSNSESLCFTSCNDITMTSSIQTSTSSANNNNMCNKNNTHNNTLSNTMTSQSNLSTVHSNTSPVAKECASCGQKIWDRYLLSCMDRHWHTSCLKCSCCQAPLGDVGATCFSKGGMILCKNDYLRLFGRTGTCHGCGNGIPANEFVMKIQGNHFFHLQCFACVVCQHRLSAGDRYCMVSGNLLCELDYPKVVKGAIHLPVRLSGRT